MLVYVYVRDTYLQIFLSLRSRGDKNKQFSTDHYSTKLYTRYSKDIARFHRPDVSELPEAFFLSRI